MPITEHTRREIETVLERHIQLDEDYCYFLIRWMALNRGYNELVEADKDYKKVLEIGQRLQAHWGEVQDLAVQLVSLECIGGERSSDYELLKPNQWVKSATLYLRDRLELQHAVPPEGCEFTACRMEKRRLCNNVVFHPWDEQDEDWQEMAALLRLVYQVRCNLVHGDKRWSMPNSQTNRDHRLVRISTRILGEVLPFLLQEA